MRVFFGILTGLLLLATGAMAESRLFHLEHRSARDVAGTVRAALGDGARVTAVDHSLFVDADPAELAIVAELLGILDHPPAMLRVVVTQNRNVTDDETQIDTSGRVSIGSSTVVLGRQDPTPQGGVSVYHDGLRVGASSTHQRGSRNVEQFIVTIEGRPARISVGQEIPFSERWLLLARRHAQVIETIRYESVDTGFEVQPELFGSLVQLDIYPFMAFRDPQQPCEIQFQELTTTVRIPLGQWYDLGGTMAGSDEVSREILGWGTRTGESGGTVRVKVELQPNLTQ